jgi:hypothetical protein
MKICYVNKRFRTATKLMIQRANDIVDEAKSAGVDLTLRQMYYEFVARNWLPNRQAAYATLGDVMTDARLAGLVDWDAIEDRTRSLKRAAHWESPTDIIKACSEQYRIDRWKDQERRVEVWVEKDTMAGVLQRSCMDLDVPFFACRGYTSATEMWGASQRLLDYIQGGQEVTIIHLGDHDPSGIDMTRDIKDRLKIFLKDNNEYIKVDRIALNMDQVTKYKCPPNPAKAIDPRFKHYAKKFGSSSWEIEALKSTVLIDLVRKAVGKYVDKQAMEGSVAEELRCRGEISLVAGQWKGVVTKATSLQKAADKKAETKRKRDEAKAKMKRK